MSLYEVANAVKSVRFVLQKHGNKTWLGMSHQELQNYCEVAWESQMCKWRQGQDICERVFTLLSVYIQEETKPAGFANLGEYISDIILEMGMMWTEVRQTKFACNLRKIEHLENFNLDSWTCTVCEKENDMLYDNSKDFFNWSILVICKTAVSSSSPLCWLNEHKDTWTRKPVYIIKALHLKCVGTVADGFEKPNCFYCGWWKVQRELREVEAMISFIHRFANA
ncbi:CLUMA_CG016640, isoform A [Clunio marinus]|uniref:CLUMA_CG016640, isoform A n=1 Tax=Clunio marinus TaxID=568069 RepID=A0A1J1IS46_9DIPT|nr:CLUMA_CG016640, isoform A [Clunio marinus]